MIEECKILGSPFTEAMLPNQTAKNKIRIFYIFINMVNIAILLTANLGVMNLLPIPALDGGRFVFLVVEAIRRKKLNPRIEGAVNVACFFVLLGLMMVVMFNDIRKIIFP